MTELDKVLRAEKFFAQIILRRMDEIMAELDDLNAAIGRLQSVSTTAIDKIHSLEQDVARLTQDVADANARVGVPAADVAASTANLNAAIDPLAAATGS